MELKINFSEKPLGYMETFTEFMQSPHQQIVGCRAEYGAVALTHESLKKDLVRIRIIDSKRVCAVLRLVSIEGGIATLSVEPSGPLGKLLTLELAKGVEFEPVARVLSSKTKGITYMFGIDLRPINS